jgi:hypothetical protein
MRLGIGQALQELVRFWDTGKCVYLEFFHSARRCFNGGAVEDEDFLLNNLTDDESWFNRSHPRNETTKRGMTSHCFSEE